MDTWGRRCREGCDGGSVSTSSQNTVNGAINSNSCCVESWLRTLFLVDTTTSFEIVQLTYYIVQHDATLCHFAHIELNKGWLCRNTSQFEYSTTMCPKTSIADGGGRGSGSGSLIAWSIKQAQFFRMLSKYGEDTAFVRFCNQTPSVHLLSCAPLIMHILVGRVVQN